MKLTHSYSAIKLFEQCPYRYMRQRITKDVKDEGGEASIYGDRVHKLLEARLKRVQIETGMEAEAEKYEPLCQSVEKMASAEGAILGVEQELVLNENLQPTTWWAADAWIRSKLDVLVVRKDRAVVMDWKSGKRRPDFFQMEMFAAMTMKHYPDVTKVTTSLVWLKDMDMDTEVYTREQFNHLWAKIMGKISKIHNADKNDNWPAVPSGLCRFCPARHDCDSARV